MQNYASITIKQVTVLNYCQTCGSRMVRYDKRLQHWFVISVSIVL